MGTIGVAAMGGDARQVVETIRDLERRGIKAAWLTTAGAGIDGLTIFAAAAATTERILLGTSITPTWPRHPIVAVQQTQVVAQLAPRRFRLGIGSSHGPGMGQMYGFDFRKPLTNVREYVAIARTLLREGKVDFDGEHYHAHASIPQPIPDLPVMAAALRASAYELCGEVTDGAISWVSPPAYLRDVAVPAIQRGAERAGRPAPPLIAHLPVVVSEDAAAVRTAVREQLVAYPRLPFYQQMFAAAGFPEAANEQWSDAMIDAVVAWGGEGDVRRRVDEMFALGAGEIIVTVVTAGDDRQASRERTLSLLGSLS